MMKYFKSPYGIIVTIIGVTILWFLSGALQDTNGPVSVKPAAEQSKPSLPQVSGILSRAESHPLYYTFNGKTEAARKVTLQSRIHSVVEKNTVPEGSAVADGELMMTLAVEDRYHHLTKAQAFVAQRELDFKVATRLAAKKYLSEKSLAEAKTNLETARWELQQKTVEWENTKIKAPFKGVLNTYHVQPGQTIQPGSPLITLVELDPLYIKIHINEQNYAHLKGGQTAQVTIEGMPPLEGTLGYIATIADPETNTFEGHVFIENGDYKIPSGMSASLKILGSTTTMMHKLPSVTLSLSDKGTVGVKTVNRTNQVEFYPVTIQETTPQDIWVTGLPPEAHIITVGQEFVKAGDQVRFTEQAAET